MIEQTFTQYGLLGIIVLTLIGALKYIHGKYEGLIDKLILTVENNTRAMTQVAETTRKCKGVRR